MSGNLIFDHYFVFFEKRQHHNCIAAAHIFTGLLQYRLAAPHLPDPSSVEFPDDSFSDSGSNGAGYAASPEIIIMNTLFVNKATKSLLISRCFLVFNPIVPEAIFEEGNALLTGLYIITDSKIL